MKFIDFLNEEIKTEEVYDIILKTASKKFLKECNNSFLYRSVNEQIQDFKTLNSFKERRPKDTPKTITSILDNWFKKKFGWKARTENVVFARNSTLTTYGTPYLFFPIGEYKYVWSPEVLDLYDHMESILLDLSSSMTLEEFKNLEKNGTLSNVIDLEELTDKINKFMDNQSYKNNQLESAIYSKHEIMFNCKKYLLVNKKYKDFISLSLESEKL